MVHKWSPSGISIFVVKYLVVGMLLYLGLYSRSEQADNEFYRVPNYMSRNRGAVSSVGIQQSDLPGCGRSGQRFGKTELITNNNITHWRN